MSRALFRGLAAIFVAAAASLFLLGGAALAAGANDQDTGGWGKRIQGQPLSFQAGGTDGYYVWHDAGGLRLRTTDSAGKFRYSGTLRTNGAFIHAMHVTAVSAAELPLLGTAILVAAFTTRPLAPAGPAPGNSPGRVVAALMPSPGPERPADRQGQHGRTHPHHDRVRRHRGRGGRDPTATEPQRMHLRRRGWRVVRNDLLRGPDQPRCPGGAAVFGIAVTPLAFQMTQGR